jgi:zinc protease
MEARLDQFGGAGSDGSVDAAQLDWSVAAIPCTVACLDNGLTVVVHREHKAPLIAIQVSYFAGSRDEPEGKAGLAHICEHLMYTGTAARPGNYFAPFEQAGATEINARVAEDYSTYFATVPTDALDFALSMEADRMAHLAAALNTERLERQREIVRNELRQREAEPFGTVPRLIAALAHPGTHPYSHPPNGILEQLDDITYADAVRWIETHHGAANAVLTIAGDVENGAAIKMAERYFGSLPAGQASPVPPCGSIRGKGTHTVLETGLKSPRVYLVWHICPSRAPEYAEFEAACAALKLKARQWSRADLLAEITVNLEPRVLGSLLVCSANARHNTAPDRLAAALLDELERLSRFGLGEGEMSTIRLRLFADLVREGERVGGVRGRADKLATAAVLHGSPRYHDRRVQNFAALTSDSVRTIIGQLMNDRPLILTLSAAV